MMVRRACSADTQGSPEKSQPKIDRRLEAIGWPRDGSAGNGFRATENRVPDRPKAENCRPRRVVRRGRPAALRTKRERRPHTGQYESSESDWRPPKWERVHNES